MTSFVGGLVTKMTAQMGADMKKMEATQSRIQDSLQGVSEHVHQVEERMQEMGTNIDKRFDDLTRMMEAMAKVKDTPVWQGSGGQRAAASQHFPKQYDIGTPPGQRRADATDDEDARTRLVQFPMGVHREHMKEVFAAMREKYEMHSVRPTIGQGGIRFGMVFRDREEAQDFEDKFRAEPFQYKDADNEGTLITLHVQPPRDSDARRRGWLVSPVYSILEANGIKDEITISFTKKEPARARVQRKMPSGRLIDLLTVHYTDKDGDIVVGKLEGHEPLQHEHTIVGSLSSHFALRVSLPATVAAGSADPAS